MHTPHTRLRNLLDLRYFSRTNSPAYDAVGNLLNIYDYKLGSPQTQSFAYDNLDRLTSVSVTGGSLGLYSESYTYDNRVPFYPGLPRRIRWWRGWGIHRRWIGMRIL